MDLLHTWRLEDGENITNGESQNGKAKSNKAKIVAQLSRIVRREGLDYDDWRYVARKVRQACDLRPPKRAKKLPHILNAHDLPAIL